MTCFSWGGILILCLAICFQLLGVPGTLLNCADSEDDFQASVMIGYTIGSVPGSLLPFLISCLASPRPTSLHALLSSHSVFHPPLFA
jgi:hypothetical protein